MDPRARRGSKKKYLGNREGLLALNPPRAAAASALGICPTKAAFVAVAAAAVRCYSPQLGKEQGGRPSGRRRCVRMAHAKLAGDLGQLSIRSRFQSNVPTGPPSVFWPLAFRVWV